MRQDRKAVSPYEIAHDIGISTRIAGKMIRRGDFGPPFSISFGGKRSHWRVNRDEYLAWLQRHGIQGKFWAENPPSSDNNNYVNEKG